MPPPATKPIPRGNRPHRRPAGGEHQTPPMTDLLVRLPAAHAEEVKRMGQQTAMTGATIMRAAIEAGLPAIRRAVSWAAEHGWPETNVHGQPYCCWPELLEAALAAADGKPQPAIQLPNGTGPQAEPEEKAAG